METILGLVAMAVLLVMGIAIFQAWQIIKKSKSNATPSEEEVRKLERRLNVIHVGVYVIVVILVFRFCLPYIAG